MGIQVLVMVFHMRIGLLDESPDRDAETGAPADVLWQLPDTLTDGEREQLVRAVRDYRGRDLRVRELFEDGMPAELMEDPMFAQCERLYLAGGDGTVHLAVQESIPSREIGLLPRGTGNDLARGLDLPVDDWEALVRVAVTGVPRPIDLGLLNQGRFVNAVTIGFGAEATKDLSGEFKSWAGSFGYALYTSWKALRAKPFELTVETAEETWKGEVWALVLINGRTVGGGLEVGRISRPDDGKLDLVWLPRIGVGQGGVGEILGDVREPDPEAFEKLEYRQGQHFRLRFSRSVAASIDGETSDLSRLDAEILPEALTILQPSRDA